MQLVNTYQLCLDIFNKRAFISIQISIVTESSIPQDYRPRRINVLIMRKQIFCQSVWGIQNLLHFCLKSSTNYRNVKEKRLKDQIVIVIMRTGLQRKDDQVGVLK